MSLYTSTRQQAILGMPLQLILLPSRPTKTIVWSSTITCTAATLARSPSRLADYLHLPQRVVGRDKICLQPFKEGMQPQNGNKKIVSDQGTDWHRARVTVPVEDGGNGEGSIRILAVATGGPNGNTAVDDITVKFGTCEDVSDDDGESLMGVDVRQRTLKTVRYYQKKRDVMNICDTYSYSQKSDVLLSRRKIRVFGKKWFGLFLAFFSCLFDLFFSQNPLATLRHT